VVGSDAWQHIFLQGLRIDLVLVGYVLIVPAAATLLSIKMPRWREPAAVFSQYYCAMVLVLIFYLELASPPFIEEYDSRPNYLFVEYLMYPKEVFSTLWKEYKVNLLAAGVLVPLVFVAGVRIFSFRKACTARISGLAFLMLLVFSPALLTLMIRSSVGHRPINPAKVAFSKDPLVNDLVLNSTYSMFYSLYQKYRHDSRYTPLGGISDKRMLKLLEERAAMQEASDVDLPFKPYNVVVILEESLGAEFVGSLGGPPITPYLDKLRHEGIWFNSLYATGTRSVNGIEAVIAGFPPSSSRSVIKLPKAQRGFFTFAHVFAEFGYRSTFIYGGEAHFDNMKSFLLNNGFSEIIEKSDFEDPVFVGSWGVSDEDIFQAAHQKLLETKEVPSFLFIFTVSNHSPWEYPSGRIEAFEDPPNTRNNTVKYADYALGTFIEKAKSSDYWDRTVFLIVADHNSRVYGADLVPIERFHIPGLILGAMIEPREVSSVVSQIDLLPTVLELIGIEGCHPSIGDNVLSAALGEGRAIMQYNESQAYMEGGKVVVSNQKKQQQFFNYIGGHLVSADTADKALSERALAHYNWPAYVYHNGLYSSAEFEGKENRCAL
jgi:phosphoglycerol transferase MdoB-like AlkP superfamily enzyme